MIDLETQKKYDKPIKIVFQHVICFLIFHNAHQLFLELLFLMKNCFWWFLCIFLEIHSGNDQGLFITADCMITRAQPGRADVAELHWVIVLFELLVSFDYFWWLLQSERSPKRSCTRTHTCTIHTLQLLQNMTCSNQCNRSVITVCVDLSLEGMSLSRVQ